MQITPINTNNKHQNFAGLWGRTSRSTDFDMSLGVPKVEDTYYYYPFIDETEEQIQNVRKENTLADIIQEDGYDKYIVRDCKICTKLPFKEANYLGYLAWTPDKKLTQKIKLVHYSVKDKYTTNEYGLSQENAFNAKVSEKLLSLKG